MKESFEFNVTFIAHQILTKPKVTMGYQLLANRPEYRSCKFEH
jgi:hypothetical protein